MSWVVAGVAAFQLISGAQQAETIRNNAEISKGVNELNAKYAELDAYHAEQDGYTAEARYQTTIDQTISSQKVVEAAKGVDVSFGTAKELQLETKLTGFLNKLDIKNRAHAQALGYENQASNIRLQGASNTAQAAYNASATETSAIISAANTALPAISGYRRGSSGKTDGYYGDLNGKKYKY